MSNHTTDEIQELRSLVELMRTEAQERSAEVAQLRTETTRLSELVADASGSGAPPDGSVVDVGQSGSTRRTMFKAGAGAAVAAAALVAPGLSSRAAAADGADLVIGANNTSSGGHTRLNSTGSGLLSNQNVFTVTDDLSSSSFPAAVGAYAQGDRVTNGLYAYADSRGSATNTGHALVVSSRSSARSHILLQSGGSDPRGDTYAHTRGEMRHSNGNLWFCTSSGTPGTWVDLAAQSTGSVTPVSPKRAYDSRFSDGPLGGGFSRTVAVTNSIDVGTGANTGPLVPAGATAVFFNITVTQTTSGGFLAAAPGDATGFEASSVNWTASGQTVANGTLSSLDAARQLRVFAGGGSAHFLIDVTGYLS
ncbi:MAG: hypothetical protein AB8G26_14075 [Ilumatobacter sp.]